MTRHFFPGMMVLMCWDFIDFNKTRLSARWTTDAGEEEDRVVNIIAFCGRRRSIVCVVARASESFVL